MRILALALLSATLLCLLVLNPKIFNSIGSVWISASCLGSLIILSCLLYFILECSRLCKISSAPHDEAPPVAIYPCNYCLQLFVEKELWWIENVSENLISSLDNDWELSIPAWIFLNYTNLLVFLLPLQL